MRGDSDLASSFLLSLVAHLSVALTAQAVLLAIGPPHLQRIFEPLDVTIVEPFAAEGGGGGDGLPPPPARGRPEPPPPAPKAAVAKPVAPKPAAVKPSPRSRAAPVREARAVPPRPVTERPPVAVAAAAPRPDEPATGPRDVAALAARGTNPVPGNPQGFALSGDGRSFVTRKVYGSGPGSGAGSGAGRRYAPDAPGFSGRLLAQISVPSTSAAGSFYGRVHLIPQDGRDYSSRTLFGYSFREDLPGGGFREFQVGRVQTHGAYLVVTDLYRDGRHSTMGHTVILAFPRAAGHAFSVRDLGGGSFRMLGPGGSALDFDGRSGRLLGARGFRIAAQGASGTAPRVSFDGFHVKIQSVGGNPFLRGRAATVFDGRGGSCSVTTADLFVNQGTRESDMFRFADDAELFAFLRGRCPGLRFPQTLPTQMVQKDADPAPASAGGNGGLIRSLLNVFR